MSSEMTSRHPHEDEIAGRYAVNAFDTATRALVACRCSYHASNPCKHIREYNRTRVTLLDLLDEPNAA